VRVSARAISRGLVALAALLVALAACGGAAAATPCWEKVQNDWTDNKRIDKTYPLACYDKAIAKLPPDLKYYSDAPDTIETAKEDRLRRTPQFYTGGDSAQGDASANGSGDGSSSSSSGKGDGGGPAGEVLNWGPSAAGDVPLPLLVIAFLALLLMGAGAAGLVNRRLHERRAGGPPQGPGTT
jgi:hypothetical protein